MTCVSDGEELERIAGPGTESLQMPSGEQTFCPVANGKPPEDS